MSGFEPAKRLAATEVTVHSLHPATYMPTKIVLSELGHHVESLEDGTAATLRLVSDPRLAATTGRFLGRTREAEANSQAYDRAARRELWTRSLALVNHPDIDAWPRVAEVRDAVDEGHAAPEPGVRDARADRGVLGRGDARRMFADRHRGGDVAGRTGVRDAAGDELGNDQQHVVEPQEVTGRQPDQVPEYADRLRRRWQ